MDRTLGNFDAGRWMKNKTGDDYTYELTKIDRCGGAGWQCVNALVKKNWEEESFSSFGSRHSCFWDFDSWNVWLVDNLLLFVCSWLCTKGGDEQLSQVQDWVPPKILEKEWRHVGWGCSDEPELAGWGQSKQTHSFTEAIYLLTLTLSEFHFRRQPLNHEWCCTTSHNFCRILRIMPLLCSFMGKSTQCLQHLTMTTIPGL